MYTVLKPFHSVMSPGLHTKERENNNHSGIPDSCPRADGHERVVVSNWTFFRSQWENYEILIGLDKKENKIRDATLLVVMGKMLS